MLHTVKIGNVEVGASAPRVVCNVSQIYCALEGLKQGADIIELRCDLIEPPDINTIEKRCRELRQEIGDSIPILGTIRRSADCGRWYRFNASEEERLGVFKSIIPYINAVDIEYGASITREVLKIASDADLTTILSYHNFAYTPSQTDLEEIVQNMERENRDILKIACMTCDDNDFDVMANMLKDYVNRENNQPITVIPMGDYGRPGRYIFPWIGSCLTYGCVREEKAPAQPFVHELVKSISLAKDVASELPIASTLEGCEAIKKLSSEIKKFEFATV